MPGFDELGLSPALLRGVREMGFEEPTPVQARSIPLLLEGKDIVAQALTGTGKTAAYGIPLIERIDPKVFRPQAVVLSPTRELAIQIAEHLAQLGRHANLRLLPIYGGQPIDRQLRALDRGVHGIVATPGRLMDHMRRGSVDLSEVKLLILDEADQMLQMGFQEDVEYVMGHLQAERVTALLSATMPKPILDIVQRYMREPEMLILSKPQELTVPAIEQTYFEVPFPRKFDALCRLLDARQPDRTVVFCATKRMVDDVVERLPAHGYAAEALHGDINQHGRERVLRAFREGRTDILVATDVAARGLDIPEVSLVVNFDIPPDPEYYVHRIGRTARSGRAGEAVTFVNPRELRELQIIERVTGARIRRGRLPTVAETEEREIEALRERLIETIERGHGYRYRKLVEGLAIDHDPLDVATASLHLATEHRITRRTPAHRPVTADETPVERPRYTERRRGDEAPDDRDRPRFEGRRRGADERPRDRERSRFDDRPAGYDERPSQPEQPRDDVPRLSRSEQPAERKRPHYDERRRIAEARRAAAEAASSDARPSYGDHRPETSSGSSRDERPPRDDAARPAYKSPRRSEGDYAPRRQSYERGWSPAAPRKTASKSRSGAPRPPNKNRARPGTPDAKPAPRRRSY